MNESKKENENEKQKGVIRLYLHMNKKTEFSESIKKLSISVNYMSYAFLQPQTIFGNYPFF